MGSRYCQVAWQASQLSTTSCSLFSVSSHSSASFSRGPMKGDALMDCVFTIWSSRMACTMRQDCHAQLASLARD